MQHFKDIQNNAFLTAIKGLKNDEITKASKIRAAQGFSYVNEARTRDIVENDSTGLKLKMLQGEMVEEWAAKFREKKDDEDKE